MTAHWRCCSPMTAAIVLEIEPSVPDDRLLIKLVCTSAYVFRIKFRSCLVSGDTAVEQTIGGESESKFQKATKRLFGQINQAAVQTRY